MVARYEASIRFHWVNCASAAYDLTVMGKLCRWNIGVSDVVGVYCRGRGGATRSRGVNHSAPRL
jgi:hypothetical protein